MSGKAGGAYRPWHPGDRIAVQILGQAVGKLFAYWADDMHAIIAARFERPGQ